jgi:DNA-binding NtrC family response regulator
VLERNSGNRTATAAQLGIGSATLYRKLKSYGLPAGSPVIPGESGAAR